MPGALTGFAIEIDKWAEAFEAAADDRHHQRKAECAGASEGFRRTANSDPDWKLRLMWTRKDALSFERRAEAAFPGDVGRLAKLEKQVELFGEELVIVTRIKAEQRVGLDEGTPADHELRTALGNQVESREFLE